MSYELPCSSSLTTHHLSLSYHCKKTLGGKIWDDGKIPGNELLKTRTYCQFRKGRLTGGGMLKKQKNSRSYSPVQTNEDDLKSYFVDGSNVFFLIDPDVQSHKYKH